MDTQKKQEMEIMHTMCQKELQELQISLSNFVRESQRVKEILCGTKSSSTGKDVIQHSSVEGGGGGNSGTCNRNMFALIAFDRYMSQLGAVVNMARKFNIHLQINKLTNAVLNPAVNGSLEATNVVTQSRILQDYIEWSNARFGKDIINGGGGGSTEDMRSDEIIESPSWKKENLAKLLPLSCPEEGIYKSSNKNEARQSLQQVVASEVKNTKHNPELQYKETMEKIENFLKIILPTKDLTKFEHGLEFSGSITYIQDYKDLVFFICELEDLNILCDYSKTQNLTPIQRSSLTDGVFCVSQNKTESNGDKDCVWRAVMVPEEGSDVQDSVYLIDFGEIIALTNQCDLYRVPSEYTKTAPLAIKCILKAVHDIQNNFIVRDHAYCEKALRDMEYKTADFRVVEQKNRILELILLEKSTKELPKELGCDSNADDICKTNSRNSSNPFLNPNLVFSDEEDEEENSNVNLDPPPLPISVVYSTPPPAAAATLSSPIIPTLNVTAQLGDKLQILVTHVVNPITFYAIIIDDSYVQDKIFSWPDHQIAMLQKQMSLPQLNDLVLAQYVKDSYWYRARVVDIDAEKDLYKVFYVDFGNTDIVPLCCLANCTEQHLEDPLRAVLFRMANLSLLMDNNDDADDATLTAVRLQKAIETVVVLILDQTINVEIVDRHKDDLVVRFTDQQYADIPEILIDMGIVKEV